MKRQTFTQNNPRFKAITTYMSAYGKIRNKLTWSYSGEETSRRVDWLLS